MKLFLFSSVLTLFTGAAYYSQNGPDPVLTFNADNGYDNQITRKPVVNGDKAGKLQFRGWVNEQDKWFLGAEIGAQVSGNPGNGYLPTDLYFSTGTPFPEERMRIKEDGRIGINTADPSARFSINDYGNPLAKIFEVLGGSGSNSGKFQLGNMPDGSLRTFLKGNMEVETGNLVVKDGKMGIGVAPNDLPGNHKLYVNGSVLCTELNVELKSDWPDFVFLNDYPLMTLEALQAYINKEGHLPGIPSAAEVRKNGINTGEMFKNVVEKIETLHLYILQQEKQIQTLQKKLADLENTRK